MRDLSNVCYVDVRAVWRHVYRVVSGIWADAISDAWPHVGRRGSSEIERSPVRVIGRLCVPSLGRQSIVAFAFDLGAFLACERGATV